MATLTKRKKNDAKLVEPGKTYGIKEAVEILKKATPLKFDPTVDLQFKLAVDPSATEQAVRGTTLLPKGTGKKVRVVVITKDEAGKAAIEAGADAVGGAELIEKIFKGWLDFDAVVASPSMMRDLAKLGKVLGPRGLMPSPKAGTVTENLGQAVKEIKLGRIEFKMDKQANIHCSIGKLSFATGDLAENGRALLDAMSKAKPKEFKGGEFIKSVHMSSTMGPGVKLDPALYKTKEAASE